MASTSKYGGDSYTEHEMNDPTPPERVQIRRAEIGFVDRKEESSPEKNQEDGGDSTRSSKSRQTPNESQKPPARSPARTTESPSKSTDQDSDAGSTGGGGRKTAGRSRKPATQEDEFDEFA